MSKYYSQWEQDKYLDTAVFRGFKNGIFVDVGAHNGISGNNTLFFEKERGWKGINIEPIKKVYNKLVENRPNGLNLNYAISHEEGELDFVCNEGYTEMLSGLLKHYDERHHNRNHMEIAAMGGKKTIIRVDTRRLETIFDKYNIKRINYLSIDVEGAEYSVIKSINFSKVFIDVIDFENNYADTSGPIMGYLEAMGYILLRGGPDIFYDSSGFTIFKVILISEIKILLRKKLTIIQDEGYFFGIFIYSQFRKFCFFGKIF